jgi:hypothetical protein
MSPITFDPSFGYGTIITLAVLISGFVGNYFLQRYQVGEMIKRHCELEVKVVAIDAAFSKHQLHISETYVRRDDLERMEERIGKTFGALIDGIGRRMETVEHTMRNIDTKILSVVQVVTKRSRLDD